MRERIKRLITSSHKLLSILNSITGNFPKVMVYHRFSPPGVTVAHRVNADVFAWQLDTIQQNFEVISFSECVTCYQKHGTWPKGCVTLTIDDGYLDMYQWAWPELVKRNLTATFFVTTGFVDRMHWLWPDQLEYVLKQTLQTSCTISIAGELKKLSLENKCERSKVWRLFTDHCIQIEDGQRRSFLKLVQEKLAVELPSTLPVEYAAVTWEHLHEMQKSGIEIGSHTVHHSILSKVSPELLKREIYDSKKILEERLAKQVVTFCYPNSGQNDINETVVTAVKSAGYNGAVFGTDLGAWDRYKVPRMLISNDYSDFLWKLYGGESLSYRIRKAKMT